MAKKNPKHPKLQAHVQAQSHLKPLLRLTSSKLSTPTRLLAQISATGLVLASAGLGSIYAWTTGSQHGAGLAALMVLMAVTLEIAKPLSLAASFSAFRSWSVVRGALLALMAVVAISYSLTAELTLMAGARGDVVAQREATLKVSTDASDEAKHARDRYEAAQNELASLPAARPASELQKQITDLLLTPGANGCVQTDGRVTKTVCPLVADLKAEKGRAERRASLEAVLAQQLPVMAHTVPQVRVADPGATALHTYAAALGFTIPANVLTEWLALIPVLALEIGSAFAGLLVQATSPSVGRRRQEVAIAAPVQEPLVHHGPLANTDDPATRQKVKVAIMDQLEKRGGSLAKSERGLAALIGASRQTTRRAINGLVIAGLVASEASRSGTLLRLVG